MYSQFRKLHARNNPNFILLEKLKNIKSRLG